MRNTRNTRRNDARYIDNDGDNTVVLMYGNHVVVYNPDTDDDDDTTTSTDVNDMDDAEYARHVAHILSLPYNLKCAIVETFRAILARIF